MEKNEDIKNAVETLKRGGLILYPTDTVWGIGCDAANSKAVKRIFELKRRADSKALICLVANEAQLERFVDGIPDVAYELLEASVRPTTIVYDAAVGLAPEVSAPDGSVGVRLTHEEISSALCRALRRPVVSTSANVSGQPSPHVFSEISPEIIDGVDYVMHSRRGEKSSPARPSSVIRLTQSGLIKILRD